MSLKAFHLFFVVVATMLALGLGSWGIRDYRASGDWVSLAVSIGAFAGGIVLFGYGRWFLRKLKNVSYI